jgi:glycosyltransferase involved in cell wall biosynthesis
MATYTASLARAMAAEGVETHLVSWTQQYPAIIPRDFIDRASRQSALEGAPVQVHYITNYNNPFTWAATVRLIKGLRPDVVVIQWSIALQGLPLGWIARKLRRAGIEVVFDLHFVIQKEHSALDKAFSRYGLAGASSFIVHARKTYDELCSLFPKKKFYLTEKGDRAKNNSITVIKLYHPIYDLYQPDPNFDLEAEKSKLNLKKHVFLFFGFIRQYKGLHHVLPAFATLARERDDVSLLVVGESFWKTLDQSKLSTRIKSALFGLAKRILVRGNSSGEQDYNPLALIDELGIADRVTVVNEYVPNEAVPRYFQVSDAIVLFYEYATPSGVESISYNFHLPVLATRVGHFPETIQDGFNGYLAEPDDVASMTEAFRRQLAQPIPSEHVAQTAQHLSWANYAKAILGRL